MRTPTIILGVLILAVGAAWLWLRPASLPPSAVEAPPQVSLGIREGSIVLRSKGVKQAEIHARRVSVSADLYYARLTGITRATIYDNGAPVIEVAAREIVMDRRTNDLEIHGPVVVTSSRGYRLTAAGARWRHALQQVVFPDGVDITLGDDRITAGSLVVDSGLQTFDLANGVEISFHLRGERP